MPSSLPPVITRGSLLLRWPFTRILYDSAVKSLRFVAVILVGAALCCANAQSPSTDVVTCGIEDLQTAPVRSSAGFTAVLNMHADDDHGLNSHQCEAGFTLQITRPDGSSLPPIKMGYWDGDWDRPLVFRIEGFSQDGRHVFVFISDGPHPEGLTALEYDMSSGSKVKVIFLEQHFTRRLSRECAATLHIVGTSPAGLIVLGSDAKDGCARAELWQLRPNKTTTDGSPVPPEYPGHLSPKTEITNLEAGIPVPPS